MTLAQYLSERGISLNEFARRVGAKNGRTIQRYVKHGSMPSSSMMAKIREQTDGQVQPNDFFAAAPAE